MGTIQDNGSVAVRRARRAKELQKSADLVLAELAAQLTAMQPTRRLALGVDDVRFQGGEAGGVGQVRELLERHRPKGRETDLRDFEWYYLNGLCHAERLTLQGGGRDVAYSPDGKRLASASVDNTVRVWDVQTGQELHSFKNGGRIVSFSPDGKRLASTGGS